MSDRVLQAMALVLGVALQVVALLFQVGVGLPENSAAAQGFGSLGTFLIGWAGFNKPTSKGEP